MLDPTPVDPNTLEPTPDSPLLSLDGAIRASGLDAGIALHYGSPLREGRALDEFRAVVDLSSWGVVTAEGPDRLTWLHSLASQKVDTLAPGTAVRALFLNLQGRIDFDTRMVDDGETTWILVEPGYAASMSEWLSKMRFMNRVTITNVTDHWAVMGARFPLAEKIEANDVLGPVWRDPWPEVCEGGWPYAVTGREHPGEDGPWCLSLVQRDSVGEVAQLLQDQGIRVAGTMAYDQVRIARWEPSQRQETDLKTIPHELDLLRTAVHMNKGCYKGQETVARVHNLGHPPRRLVFLDLDGSEHTLPEPGAEVKAGDRKIGTVTSSILHHDAGPIALAMVRRNVATDEELEVVDGGQTYQANQTVIVPKDAGNVVGRPKDVGRMGPGMGKDLR